MMQFGQNDDGFKEDEVTDKEETHRRIKEMIDNSANYILLAFEDLGEDKPPLIRTASSMPTLWVLPALSYASTVIRSNIQEAN